MKTTSTHKKKTPLVIGNWKMNPATLEKAETLFNDVKKALGNKNTQTEVVIAPSHVHIAPLQRLAKKTSLSFGAQNASHEEVGAHTGDISLSQLKSIGVTHVIVGHSERRALGETDELVRIKTEAVLKNRLTAVVCVGEKVRDTQGDYFSFVESQIKSLVVNLKKNQLAQLVIAYEPIWAIGTSLHATPEDVQEMKLFIQKALTHFFDRNVVSKVRIIYGGSVTKDNAKELLEGGHADGFLVGGSSLKASEFAGIVEISNAYAKE